LLNGGVEQRETAATKGANRAKTRPAVSRLLQRELGDTPRFLLF
jgi:hypothetical protein